MFQNHCNQSNTQLTATKCLGPAVCQHCCRGARGRAIYIMAPAAARKVTRRHADRLRLLLIYATVAAALGTPQPDTGPGRTLLDAGNDKVSRLVMLATVCLSQVYALTKASRRLVDTAGVVISLLKYRAWCQGVMACRHSSRVAGAEHRQHLHPGWPVAGRALLPGSRKHHRRPGVHKQRRRRHHRALLRQHLRLWCAPSLLHLPS